MAWDGQFRWARIDATSCEAKIKVFESKFSKFSKRSKLLQTPGICKTSKPFKNLKLPLRNGNGIRIFRMLKQLKIIRIHFSTKFVVKVVKNSWLVRPWFFLILFFCFVTGSCFSRVGNFQKYTSLLENQGANPPGLICKGISISSKEHLDSSLISVDIQSHHGFWVFAVLFLVAQHLNYIE